MAKRVIDIVFSLLAIAFIMSWLSPVVAVCIKLSSRGPIFFRQNRVGLNGKMFQCLKFRSMIVNEEADVRPAGDNDDRITRFGRFLRRTNIDELPQLFNVLIGQMSLAGPRPHMLSDCVRFAFMITDYDARHIMKPGITGLAQIKGYNGPAQDYESIVCRFYWDKIYTKKASLALDLKIIAHSCVIPFRSLATSLQRRNIKKKTRYFFGHGQTD